MTNTTTTVSVDAVIGLMGFMAKHNLSAQDVQDLAGKIWAGSNGTPLVAGTMNDTTTTAAPKQTRKPGEGKGNKRDPELLTKLGERFCEFVAKHPGSKIEAVNKALSLEAGELALPIKKLIADGSIKTKGQRRGTTYFVKG